MDGETTVPLNWLLYLGGVLVIAFVWWLRREFTQNAEQHLAGAKAIRRVHRRLDYLIMNLLGRDYPPQNDDEEN